jgi:hypothetical protein
VDWNPASATLGAQSSAKLRLIVSESEIIQFPFRILPPVFVHSLIPVTFEMEKKTSVQWLKLINAVNRKTKGLVIWPFRFVKNGRIEMRSMPIEDSKGTSR